MAPSLRRLASDTVVYGVSTVLQRFLTFMLTPLYTNYLSASAIGDVTAIYAVIAFVNIVYSFGMEPAFMRFFDKDDAEASERAFVVSSRTIHGLGIVVTAATILFAGAIAASPLLDLGGDGARLVRWAAWIPFLDAIVLMPYARLRMRNRPRRFAILRLVAVVANVALNVVFVIVLRWGIDGVVLAGVLSSAVGAAFFVPDIVEAYRRRFDRGLFGAMLRFGLPTVPGSVSAIMVQMADRPIMMASVGSAAVGLYQTNFRLALPMMLFGTVFEYAWKPFYLNHRNDPTIRQTLSRVLTLFTVVCGFVYLGTALFMPYVVRMPFIGGRFINPAFWSGLGIVPIVLLAYYFNGVFTNLAAGFHIAKRTGFFPLATGLAAVANVVLTIVLVPVLGIDGAAWAKVAAYVVSVLALAIPLRRVYPVDYDWMRVLWAVLCAAALHGLVSIVPDDTTLQLVVRSLCLPAYAVLMMVGGVVGRQSFSMITSLVRR